LEILIMNTHGLNLPALIRQAARVYDDNQLEALLLDYAADCRGLCADSVQLHTAAELLRVRGLLGPLAALAAERNLAVLAVTHLRKEEGAAMYRTMGSMAFIAAARAAWIVCKDKDDPRRRLLLPVKNNLASDTSGLAYTIEPHGPSGEAVVCWSASAVDIPADSAIERQHARQADRMTNAPKSLAG
jgi:putative DNA primase/helicase